jgi:NAD(P)-dependent dehydrogenase (short-subunit alcohol dehydrogenase family)
LLKQKYPEVDYRPLILNLSSQKDVRAAAKELLSWDDVPTVDIVINSAGIMLLPERTLSEDGIEMHFATNHIGHWLFSCLIMPKLIKSAEGNGKKGATRIINVTSGSPRMAQMRWSDTNFNIKNKDLPEAEQPNYAIHQMWGVGDVDLREISYIPLEGYNQSKVANVLFGIAANKRLFEKHGILVMAVHPGVIPTELGRNATNDTLEAIEQMSKKGTFTYKTLGGGSSTSLVAALDPKLSIPVNTDTSENHGAYFEDCQICDGARPLVVSSSEAEKLWKMSEELVKEKFAW